jgi:hypothetical protein
VQRKYVALKHTFIDSKWQVNVKLLIMCHLPWTAIDFSTMYFLCTKVFPEDGY